MGRLHRSPPSSRCDCTNHAWPAQRIFPHPDHDGTRAHPFSSEHWRGVRRFFPGVPGISISLSFFVSSTVAVGLDESVKSHGPRSLWINAAVRTFSCGPFCRFPGGKHLRPRLVWEAFWQASECVECGEAWPRSDNLIMTRTGCRPVEP